MIIFNNGTGCAAFARRGEQDTRYKANGMIQVAEIQST